MFCVNKFMHCIFALRNYGWLCPLLHSSKNYRSCKCLNTSKFFALFAAFTFITLRNFYVVHVLYSPQFFGLSWVSESNFHICMTFFTLRIRLFSSFSHGCCQLIHSLRLSRGYEQLFKTIYFFFKIYIDFNTLSIVK